jgi:thiamine-monophosphate kinase
MEQEDQLIERIRRAIPSRNRGSLRLGIGDDAAVISSRKGFEWVLSCDAFLEGVHFLANRHPADSVGFKALVRATSDLAAMGAQPRTFLLTLALPSARTGKWLDEFLRGMGRAARQLGMRIAGGDSTKSTRISISITVLGEVGRGLAVTRSGARPGDVLCVSGRLGGAELGFKMVQTDALKASNWNEKESNSNGKDRGRMLRPHLYPQIRVALGAWLAARRVASAMIDISDGLSTDLARLCAASAAGARIWAERIPCVKVLAALKLDPLQMALHGGDDYELLFAVPRRKMRRLRRAPGYAEIVAIGEIERGAKIMLVDDGGRAKILRPGGWDPFGRKR